jgi:hypothetical protein
MIKVSIPNWAKFNPRSDRANYSWFRLENNFFHDQAIFGLTDSQKVLYLFMLCEASKKNSGTLIIRPNYLVALAGADQKKIDKDIKALIDCGLLTSEGRQDDGIEPALLPATNERTNERISSASPPEAGSPEGKNQFEEFWQSYPRRHEPNPRKKSFQIFTKLSTDDQAKVLVATKNYTRHCHADGKFGTKFVMQSTTFLNGRWLDWVETKLPGASASSVPEISPHGIPDEKDLPIQTEEERAAAIKEFFDKVRVMCPPTEEKVPNGE